MEYLVGLMDGARFKTSAVNIQELKKQMDSNRVYAVKLGNKGVIKQQIAFVVDAKHQNNLEATVSLTVAGETFGLTAVDVGLAIVTIVDDINNHNWVNVSDSILFNRNAFQYVEEKLAEV